MKLIKQRVNSLDHSVVRANFEGLPEYVADFSIGENFAWSVYHVAKPNRKKKHKDYMMLRIYHDIVGDKKVIVSGMDKDAIRKFAIRDALWCHKCDEVIYSAYRWNSIACSCGDCEIDGGQDYTKHNLGGTLVRVNLLTGRVWKNK